MEDHRYHHPDRYPPVGHRAADVVRSTKILPPSPGQDAQLLPVPPPAEGGLVVLRYRLHPKPHALDALRPQLVLPVEQRPHLDVAGPPIGDLLLHRRVGRYPLAVRPPLESTLVDLAAVRHRPGGTALGTDLVGHVEHRPIRALGRRLHRRRVGLALAVAVVGRVGLGPGRRAGHDPARHADSGARCGGADLGANLGLGCDRDGEGLHAESLGARAHQSGHQCGCVGDVHGVVLDCADCEFGYLCGVLHVLSEGTA